MVLSRLRRAVLDTSACIYYLELPSDHPRRAALEPLMRRRRRRRAELLLSPVTVTELMTGVLRAGDQAGEGIARVFIHRTCRIVAADGRIAERAARLRVDYGLRTPDALVCATALEVGADAIVGNDAAWKRVRELPYVHLDDIVE